MHLHPGHHDRRERLVDLVQVDVADRHAAALEHPFGGGHRPVEVVVGLGADQALGHDPRPRAQAEGACLALLEQQHRGGAVGDLRGRARGVHAVLEHGPQFGQRLQAGLAQALVAVHRSGLAGRLAVRVQHRRLHRHDLAVEPPVGPGQLGQGLRAQAEAVHLVAGQAAPVGDPLCGQVLVRHVDVPGGGPGRARVDPDVGPQRHPAHRLHAAGDAGLDRVGRDEAGHEVRRLLRRAALGVQGQAARLVRQARVQPRGAGDVAGLLARLGHAAAGHLLHLGGVDARAIEQPALGAAEDLRGVHACEYPAAFANRCPDSLHDHRSAHRSSLCARSAVPDVAVPDVLVRPDWLPHSRTCYRIRHDPLFT